MANRPLPSGVRPRAGGYEVREELGRDANGRRQREYHRCADLPAALALKKSLAARTDAGLNVALSRQTLGEWFAEYSERWRRHVAPRTRNDDAYRFKKYVSARLRGTKLSALTPAMIQDWINDLEALGLGPRTIQLAHTAVRKCINKAVVLGKLTRNPASGLAGVEVPTLDHVERVWLDAAQAGQFLAAAKGDRLYAFFVCALMLGLRPGELRGLKWADLDGDTVRVRRTERAKAMTKTKTKQSARPIPMPPVVVQVLKAHRATQAAERLKVGRHYEDQGLIFASELGGPLDNQNITNRHFKPILRRAKLADMRLYDLRHSCASILLQGGEHAKIVQERLGHKSIAQTLDTYSHVSPSMQASASAKLEAMVMGPLNAAQR
jgi:integrase